MKTFGWIFLVIGILNFILFVIGASQGEPRAGQSLNAALLFGVLGAFMISRGKKKEQEEKEKREWSKTD